MTQPANGEPLPQTPEAVQNSEDKALTLTELFHVLGKHIITAVITAVIVMGAAVGYLFVTPPKYSATAQLFATYSDTGNLDNYSSLNSAGSYISTQVKSYPALVSTKAVLEPVIEQLGLDETVARLESQVSASNPSDTAFINISATTEDPQRSADIANAAATSLQNLVQTSLYADQVQSPVKITIVQNATPPSSASSPKTSMILVLGFAAAIVLGILAALLKDLFTRKIQDEGELSSYINSPVLGRIPESDDLFKSKPAIIMQPGGIMAEKFRRICTNLSFIAPVAGTNSRLIVISAVGINEGKTTVATNIAAALAENGSTVLLVDADLRHPSIAKALEIDGSTGLGHVLSGQASVKDVVQRYWKSNLHVMPGGPKPPNAATLLNSPIMTELLAQALHQYDYVIVDTAPMVVANEAALFAKQGGGLVLVSRRGVTLKRELANVAAELKNLSVGVTGFVVNFARENKKLISNSDYYYYYNDSDDDGHKRKNHQKHS